MNIITVLIMYFILIVLEPSFLILYIYMVNTLSYYYSTFVILSVYSTILKPAQNLNTRFLSDLLMVGLFSVCCGGARFLSGPPTVGLFSVPCDTSYSTISC